MDEQEFRRMYLGEFPVRNSVDMEEPLDKSEVTDMLNMMFRFHLRTGIYFKIEEYIDSIFILTDINKIIHKDIDYFHRRHRHICNKIWFTPLSPDKTLVNVYEDCPKQRRVYYPSYARSSHFLNILGRTQSMSFILDS